MVYSETGNFILEPIGVVRWCQRAQILQCLEKIDKEKRQIGSWILVNSFLEINPSLQYMWNAHLWPMSVIYFPSTFTMMVFVEIL